MPRGNISGHHFFYADLLEVDASMHPTNTFSVKLLKLVAASSDYILAHHLDPLKADLARGKHIVARRCLQPTLLKVILANGKHILCLTGAGLTYSKWF